MTTKRDNLHSGNNQQYDDIEYAIYCDGLEKQYKQAKEDSLFEVLKILDLDEEHSDNDLIQAVNYFKKNDGCIGKDAPVNFLTEREKRILNKDGKFRSGLYCMLLSIRFSEAIQNKSVFLQHSLKFAFDKP
ncbi:hypothetical protein OQJ13_16885 [Legionella sp. PATHC035]|uniref:Uncharacterized protein n=1 Tax=Legionella steelei TaxID=947033 RepID=A0A0W0ZRA1_9GAMM|nr:MULTISPECIES: hypothetical protein [Legionella]KTD71570.1 hypothetical protein Lste_0145 [Legionella steelei]MCW8410656.1 hypothetical protein [Legionella sp. PATHC035]